MCLAQTRAQILFGKSEEWKSGEPEKLAAPELKHWLCSGFCNFQSACWKSVFVITKWASILIISADSILLFANILHCLIKTILIGVYQLSWHQLDSIQSHSDNTQTPKIWHILDYQDKQAGSKVQSEKTIKDFKSVSEETKDKVTLFLTSLAANLGLWQLELGWCRRENIWSWGIFHSATKTQSNRDTI